MTSPFVRLYSSVGPARGLTTPSRPIRASFLRDSSGVEVSGVLRRPRNNPPGILGQDQCFRSASDSRPKKRGYSGFGLPAASLMAESRVVNAGTLEVRYFSAGGAFLRSFGRRGEGPGEFVAFSPSLQVLAADSRRSVDDPRLRRVTVVADDGGSTSLALETPPDVTSVAYVGRLSDGSHIAAHT